MSAPITRIGKVSVLGRLDELEQLMLQYRTECAANHDSNQLLRELILSGFLIWLSNRHRERQWVVGDSDV